MPWTGKSFAKHNKKLSGAVATKAAKQANAILRSGAPEGVAIATASKHADKHLAARHAGASPRTPAEHMAARQGQGVTYRELAVNHGTSASTAHRRVKAQNVMARGYTRDGGAY